ncbi:hypothetical protein [uncultured Brevundimonas sp.]|uniref:hypothetical protein n=1 Tax=uncultured Brevundimonas sp. TaxID=213418 RepID=UPI0030EF7104|tara:strand:+ start:96 stop:974 length:879 start_codon:yes stop_codon:yes gene_type:complete
MKMRGHGLTAAVITLALGIAVSAGQPARAQTNTVIERSSDGALTAADRTETDGSFFDCHALSIAPGDVATVVVTSDAFEPYLSVTPGSDCRGLRPIWFGMDTGTGQGDTFARFRAQQETYGLIVNAGNVGETGAYTVHIRIEPAAMVGDDGNFSRPVPEVFVTELLKAGSPDPCSQAALRRWTTEDLAARWFALADRGGYADGANRGIKISGAGYELFSEMSADGRSATVVEGIQLGGTAYFTTFTLLNSERGWRLDDFHRDSPIAATGTLRDDIAAASAIGSGRSGQCRAG